MPVLYIHPIKQGLKLVFEFEKSTESTLVLYIHPIKQGLKHIMLPILNPNKPSSLHTSNKTRIETELT